MGRAVRRRARPHRSLAAPLSAEDQTVQSMPDVSRPNGAARTSPGFSRIFCWCRSSPAIACSIRPSAICSIPITTGRPRHPRPARGLLSRPGIDEIARYRADVDGAMRRLILDRSRRHARSGAAGRIGLHHEQQHQELLLMDILHVFSNNSLDPAYRPARAPTREAPPLEWLGFMGGCGDRFVAMSILLSITRRRATVSGWSRSASRRGSSPAANISPLWR